MIDVQFVIAHSLWILGAAVALAAVSYYQWLESGRCPCATSCEPSVGWKASFAGGVLLVASGFLLMDGTRWWERGLWLLVWAGAAFDLWRCGGRRSCEDVDSRSTRSVARRFLRAGAANAQTRAGQTLAPAAPISV